MWIFFILVIVAALIWLAVSGKQVEKEQIEKKNRQRRKDHISKDFPNAYNKYWGKEVKESIFIARPEFSRRPIMCDESLEDSRWELLEHIALKIKEDEKMEEEREEKWVDSQNTFSKNLLSFAKNKLNNFRRGVYLINIQSKVHLFTIDMFVIHLESYHVCYEKDLDYSYHTQVKELTRVLPTIQKRGMDLPENRIKQIYEFISHIAKNRNVVVFFNDNIQGWTDEALCRTYSRIDRPQTVKVINVAAERVLGRVSSRGIDLLARESPDCVVIIDAFSTRDQVVNNCKQIFDLLRNKNSLLSYISLIQSYDRDEMLQLIEQSKAKALWRESERKRREAEEQKKLENEKRKKELREKLVTTAKQVLTTNTKDWDTLNGNFHYTWLLDYYPTTCDFIASRKEWNDRYTIWDFKNDPDKEISKTNHSKALDYVIPRIIEKLSDTFGEDYLQFITLVCIPASTKIKNNARYEEFAKRICEECGMENGFTHINILKDGMSKKDPNNETGKSIQPKVAIDDWFNGRYVLLFDDVITKGNTMMKYKSLLEEKGAYVIGGLSIGKTRHERPEEEPTYAHIFDEPLPEL